MRHCVARSAVVVIALVAASPVSGQLPPDNIPQTVDYFLAKAHGLTLLTAADGERLEQLRRNAPQASRYIEALFGSTNVARIHESQELMRFERAMAVLAVLADSVALSVLGRWDEALDRDAVTNPASSLERRVLLASLGTVRVPVIIDRLLKELERLDYAALAGALGYLRRCCQGDAKVIASIEAYIGHPSSPLYRSEDLRRTLAWLRK